MVRNKKIIIAIGGGGFTHSSDEDLDEFVINQVNKSKINIGFLPTASNDNQEKIDLFYNRFIHLVEVSGFLKIVKYNIIFLSILHHGYISLIFLIYFIYCLSAIS